MPSVNGAAPFEFTDTNGRQVLIPLSVLSFDSSGALSVNATKWAAYAGYQPAEKTLIQNLLDEFASQQVFIPQPAASPKPAMVIKAAVAGAAGNGITVGFAVTPAANLDPTQATFNVTANETDTYPGLTVAAIEGVLGDGTTAGSQPGLVVVVPGSPDATKLPDDNKTYNFPAPADNNPSLVSVLDSAAAVVFQLKARAPGAGDQFLSASIANVNAPAKTFQLRVTWNHTANGAKIGTAQQDLSSLAYLITVAPPASGAFSVPTDTGAKPIPLSGGADNPPATASAAVFASQ